MIAIREPSRPSAPRLIELCRPEQHVAQAHAHILGTQRLRAHHRVGTLVLADDKRSQLFEPAVGDLGGTGVGTEQKLLRRHLAAGIDHLAEIAKVPPPGTG